MGTLQRAERCFPLSHPALGESSPMEEVEVSAEPVADSLHLLQRTSVVLFDPIIVVSERFMAIRKIRIDFERTVRSRFRLPRTLVRSVERKLVGHGVGGAQ